MGGRRKRITKSAKIRDQYAKIMNTSRHSVEKKTKSGPTCVECRAEPFAAVFFSIVWMACSTNKIGNSCDVPNSFFCVFLRQVSFILQMKNSSTWRSSITLEIRPQMRLLKGAPPTQMEYQVPGIIFLV